MSVEVTAEAPNKTIIHYANNPTVNEILDEYLRAKRDPNAYRPCKTSEDIALHLKSARAVWGTWRIEDFRRGSKLRVENQVSLWRAGEDGVCFATCRKRLTLFRAAFNHSVSYELIERGQVPVFDLPPNSPPRARYIDPEKELGRLLDEADDPRTPFHIRGALWVLLITGVRCGALLALKWSNVNFEKRVVAFRDTEAAHERTKKRRIDQPMSDALYKVLIELKERATSEYVIEWRGKGVKTVYPAMKKLFARAGIPDVRVHDIRRTSATLVYRGLGGDVQKAANHIGDSTKVAESVYIRKQVEDNLAGVEAATASILDARRK